MKFISDELLVEAFVKAVTLEYNPDLINLLESEINSREINMVEVLQRSKIGY